MAQLPPKIPPSLTSNWPDFINPHHNKLFALNNLPPTASPSWVDEFLDFSSSRRDTHRRSISDSDIAFEKLDDEQFLSMFAEEKPSRPSHTLLYPKSNSSHENTVKEEERSSFMDEDNQLPRPLELKTEPEEVQSPCESDTEACPREGSTVKSTETTTDSGDKITDPKRVKRILANRQSAQRSRVRKLQYLSDLERSVTSLQAKVSVLSPRVAFLDHHRLLLNVDNSALKQRIAALAQDRIFKDAHHEALKKEIDRLKQVYEQQQNSKNIENNNATATASPDPSSESEAAH